MVRLRLFMVIVASFGCATQAAAAQNLIANPRFEIAAKQGGGPDHWQLGGDSRLVTQTLTVEQGREGRRCARLTCTRFRDGNAGHAMLCQMGTPVQRGKTYRVALWARATNIQAEMVSLALCDTAPGASAACGPPSSRGRSGNRWNSFFRRRAPPRRQAASRFGLPRPGACGSTTSAWSRSTRPAHDPATSFQRRGA